MVNNSEVELHVDLSIPKDKEKHANQIYSHRDKVATIFEVASKLGASHSQKRSSNARVWPGWRVSVCPLVVGDLWSVVGFELPDSQVPLRAALLSTCPQLGEGYNLAYRY